MPLFQKSVLNKFLKTQDNNAISKAYKKFTKHFHNSAIQENIRNSKEEQYQEGFLRELFVDVLGYTLNPQPKYNLTTELKNEKGAKKTDGAILKDGQALGVIELKGTDTKDLEKVRQQAFDYKANQTGCVYVITSNFEKLRFYINNAVEYEEFDLFTLTEKQFELFYLCLAADNLLGNVPLKIKDASITEEENITKKFYADYSLFKRELYRDLVKRNLKNEIFREQLQAEDETRALKNIKLTLFKKSQKLIDRFLFIFFAEDRGLLPPNSTHKILEDWNKLKDMDAAVPLYNRFKLYFSYLDTGRKGTGGKAEIFAYNGGLFKPDGTLDSLILDDELLFKHSKTLANYDFESQVDVNILGHIFENSLNEIESVNAEIEGTEFDKQKTKRKKDGVFYTPKYITKYIVDNTVGKLCTEKRAELGIVDEEYTIKRQKETKKVLLDKLEQYRAWLLELTICDPACGSGAFLNQALDFLIHEHAAVDELQSSLLGGGMVFPDIENSILEKNIYGVDLNEESVEIAKLSLWLRTAQPRRKLNDLNNNIKCGNSLIESKAVAGDKAFKWEDEFPEVFAKGGFDVVIGNPPYVRHELLKDIKPYLSLHFQCFNNTSDLYTYFYEKGLKILNARGIFGFITPNKFIESNYGESLRYLLNQYNVSKIIDFGELPVFQEASTFPCILIIDKKRREKLSFSKIRDLKFSDLDKEVDDRRIVIEPFDTKSWILVNKNETDLLEKLAKNRKTLNEYVNGAIKFGLKTGFNEAFVINSEKRNELIKLDTRLESFIRPFVNGNNVRKYKIEESGEFIILAKKGLDLTIYEAIMSHFTKYEAKLRKRSDKGEFWYDFRTCSYYDEFDSPKIIYPDIALESRFSIDETGLIPNATLFMIPNADRFLLGILNCSVSWYYLKNTCPVIGDKSKRGRLRLKTIYIKNLPIPDANDDIKKEFTFKVDFLLGRNKDLQNVIVMLIRFLESIHFNVQITQKLQSWHELTFADFIKELNKAIKKSGGTPLSKLQEMEWMEVFETKKKEALELTAEIDKTDKEIDQMVYELYGLTEEEIAIVENA